MDMCPYGHGLDVQLDIKTLMLRPSRPLCIEFDVGYFHPAPDATYQFSRKIFVTILCRRVRMGIV